MNVFWLLALGFQLLASSPPSLDINRYLFQCGLADGNGIGRCVRLGNDKAQPRPTAVDFRDRFADVVNKTYLPDSFNATGFFNSTDAFYGSRMLMEIPYGASFGELMIDVRLLA